MPEDNQANVSQLLDMEMLFIAGGRERKRSEFEALFDAAGLRLQQVVPTGSSVRIEADPFLISPDSDRTIRRIHLSVSLLKTRKCCEWTTCCRSTNQRPHAGTATGQPNWGDSS